MNLKELLAAARKAIADGDLDKADALMEQAKRLKAVDDLTPVEPVVDDSKTKALEAQIADLEAFKAKIEAEPAIKAGGTLVVTEDEADKKADKPWKSLGEFLREVYIAATEPHRTDERLKAQKAVLGASEGVPADGGFLVQTDQAAEIFRIAHDQGQILTRTRGIPIGANSNGLTMNAVDETSRATGSRWGGVQAYWASEGDTAAATRPKFRQMELKLNKLLAFFYSTDELLADTTALGAVAEEAVSEEITWQTENAFVRGTGAGQPLGVLNANCLVTVAKEGGQAAATIAALNIMKMWSRMHGRSRQNAIWMINQDIEPQLFSLDLPVGTGGIPAFLPPGGLSQSPYGTLFGKPLIPVEYASTLGTAGDIILADWKQYIQIDKGGVQAAQSMHVAFLTDQMTFRWTYRVDGQPGWRSALTPANGSATQSPFVALATRA